MGCARQEAVSPDPHSDARYWDGRQQLWPDRTYAGISCWTISKRITTPAPGSARRVDRNGRSSQFDPSRVLSSASRGEFTSVLASLVLSAHCTIYPLLYSTFALVARKGTFVSSLYRPINAA